MPSIMKSQRGEEAIGGTSFLLSYFCSQLKAKESKFYKLEEAFNALKLENMKAIENFTKDMQDLQNNHKFVTEDLRLQLANAQVQLRDIDAFREQKSAIEQEITSLKEQLEREKKEHQEAISDTERAALQEKQRLRKEMLTRIQETKMQMLQHMDEQLDAKTKKTIAENDHLAKELGYHIRQSELLLQKNEKLAQENVELHRQVLLAKEVEEELAKRNLTNQRTIRILLYKLQDVHAGNPECQGIKIGLPDHKGEDLQINKDLEEIKRYIQQQTRALESVSGAEEAMRFLYACLEDIELENVSEINGQVDSHHAATSTTNIEEYLELPCSLDQLTLRQRQKLLLDLLRTAISLRAVTQDPGSQKTSKDLSSMMTHESLSAANGAFSVDDILTLSVDSAHLDGLDSGSVKTGKLVSVGVQTEVMNLEERLALDIKERLRPCSSVGIMA
ncbi:hypothetical protein KP509_29G039200 [Ceratopteris richardii]|uniref:Cilia- and flagella-associated protein 157 n=1 Tax=Ceratopteris richardii TaxID=49495 RepID=A0A8T2R810_CERRI|nr:hypothetical protein KP509_29G039200 [Ceratopteris richardii]KAH7291869.1 hypothetical protein KP509_29G039200 [Ceratopteris richardii]